MGAIVTIQRAWRKHKTAPILNKKHAMQSVGSLIRNVSLNRDMVKSMTSSCPLKPGANAEDVERLQSSVDHLTQQVDSLRREMRDGFLRLGVIPAHKRSM